jgi:hypothetical protein
MSKAKSDEYQRLLDEAGDEAEAEADANLLGEALDERLNALEAGGFDIGEAERSAALADAPTLRADGQVVGIAEGRSKPLTSQQVLFCQGVIEGKSKRQAYRDAYPNAKGSDATVSACAHRLAKDPRIQRMIQAGWEETTEALADDVASTKRYVMRSLVALSKGGKQEGSRLKALELLGRASGMWQAQQPEAEKPVTADQLRKELAGHLKLVGTAKGV